MRVAVRLRLIVALAGAVAGCAGPVNVAGSVLTSGASLQGGRRTATAQFTHDDYVVQIVDFTWADLNREGGRHRCTWNWYKGDQLVSKTPFKYVRFLRSPASISTSRPAATLGTGEFRVETVVDDQIVASSRFVIL